MSKSLTYKILAAVMALSAANWALPADVSAGYVEYGDYYVTADGETISKNYPNVYGNGHSFTITGCTIGNVYGAGNGNYYEDASGGNVTINGNAEVTHAVFGGRSNGNNAHHNTVNISGGSVTGKVYGGDSGSSQAYDNTVNISGGSIGADQQSVNVYGGWSTSGSSNDNEIIISGSADIAYANLYGGYKDTDTGNTLTINGWKGNTGNGDCTIKRLYNFESINFDNLINLAKTTNFTVTDSVNNVGAVNINSIGAGDYRSGTSKNIKLTLDNNKLDPNKITIIGDYDPNKYYTSERVNADGLFVNKYSQINVEKDANNTNTIKISATVEKSALAGTFIDANGTVYKNTNRTPYNTNDDTTSLTIGNGFTAETDVVAGAYAAGSQTATGGIINISGTTTWEGTVYAGYSESGSVNDNTINIAAGTKATQMTLKGYNNDSNADGNAASSHNNNTLNITGNGSVFKGIENFETINFNNVALNNDAALSLISANLNGTTLNVKSLAGGNNFKAGDTVNPY